MFTPSANWTRRIVLLHHAVSRSNPNQAGRSDHFDLLVEPDDSSQLWTWNCPRNPFESSNQNHPIPAQRLPDHRRIYLEYEGPIAQDRGHVRQVASGYYHGQLESNVLWLAVKLTPAEKLTPAGELPLAPKNQFLIDGSLELSLSKGSAWNIIFHSTNGQ